MKREPRRRRTRVYYSVLALLLMAAGERAEGQVSLSVSPAMTKGPASAPVTVVEFSDYQ